MKEFENTWLDKMGIIEEEGKNFQDRQGTPTLSGIQLGEWLKMLKERRHLQEDDLSIMVKKGCATRTRNTHRRFLKELETIQIEEQMDLENLLLWHFEKKYHSNRWKPSTLVNAMASAMGALANLPVYREGMGSIALKAGARWRMGD